MPHYEGQGRICLRIFRQLECPCIRAAYRGLRGSIGFVLRVRAKAYAAGCRRRIRSRQLCIRIAHESVHVNVLDQQHREFIGSPEIGRMGLVQMTLDM